MRPYSTDLRDRVVVAMESGGSCRDVGAQFGVAPSTAGNW
ncbi:MAG: IS630 family transposase, partial [Novosphingobium sp.]